MDIDIDIILNIIVKIKPDANYNDVVRGVWAWDDKISFRHIRNHVEALKFKLAPFSCEHRGDVRSIIDGCYVSEMSSDELIKRVWEKDDTIKVGTIARHFYRVRAKSLLSEVEIVKHAPEEIPEKPVKTVEIEEIPEKPVNAEMLENPINIKLPSNFSYEKCKLFNDLMKYGVRLVYSKLHRYGFGRDEIEAINEVNGKEIIAMGT